MKIRKDSVEFVSLRIQLSELLQELYSKTVLAYIYLLLLDAVVYLLIIKYNFVSSHFI